MNAARRVRSAILALIAGLCGTIILMPVDGQAQTLSEKLTRKIGQARKAEAERNFERALTVYNEALEVDTAAPDVRQVLRMRAKLFEQLEDFPRAEKDLTAALRVEPSDLSLYVERGYFYMRRGRYGDAMVDFSTGARLDPTNPVFSFATGRVETALGRHMRAIESYNHALALAPDDARALLARAESHVHLGLLGKARDDYRKVLALTLERPQDRFFAFIGCGYVAMMLGDLAAAIGDFDGALAVNPRAPRALAWRGFAYEKQGRHDRALSDYERAAALDPADTVMRANVRRLRGE